MMSVFKVHQALALCNDFDNKGGFVLLLEVDLENNKKTKTMIQLKLMIRVYIL